MENRSVLCFASQPDATDRFRHPPAGRVERSERFVWLEFPTKVTPFDAGYGQRRQPRKNSIYLMKYWGEDENKEILYDKYLKK